MGDSATDPCALTVGTNGWIESLLLRASQGKESIRVDRGYKRGNESDV